MDLLEGDSKDGGEIFSRSYLWLEPLIIDWSLPLKFDNYLEEPTMETMGKCSVLVVDLIANSMFLELGSCNFTNFPGDRGGSDYDFEATNIEQWS